MSKKKLIFIGLAVLVLAASYNVGQYRGNKAATSAPILSTYKNVDFLQRKTDTLLSKVVANKNLIRDIESKNLNTIRQIEQQLAQLSQRPESSLDPISVEPTHDSNGEAPSHDVHDFIEKETQAYNSEVVDFTWAPEAENTLESGLTDLATNLGFEVANSECRTSRCNATITFDNYNLAEKHGHRLAEASIPGLNCAQSIALPPPSDASARYEVNLMLDCSQQIQGLVQSHD